MKILALAEKLEKTLSKYAQQVVFKNFAQYKEASANNAAAQVRKLADAAQEVFTANFAPASSVVQAYPLTYSVEIYVPDPKVVEALNNNKAAIAEDIKNKAGVKTQVNVSIVLVSGNKTSA